MSPYKTLFTGEPVVHLIANAFGDDAAGFTGSAFPRAFLGEPAISSSGRTNVESGAGIDLEFLKRDLQLGCRRLHDLPPFGRELVIWARHLFFRSDQHAVGHRKQHSYGRTDDLCDTRLKCRRRLYLE